MTVQYRNLAAADIKGKNVFLAGNNDEQLQTCRQIIGTWKELGEDAPLVVFDHDGSIYRDFGGGNLLADCASVGSVMPDCLMPVLRHAQFGASAQVSADVLRKCIMPEKPDRNSNDSFWTMSASSTLRQWIEYGLVLTRNAFVIRSACPSVSGKKFNTLLTFASFSDLLCDMMSEIASSHSKYNNTSGGPGCNLSYEEQFVFDYANYGGPRSKKVFESLQNTGASGNAGTSNCILKTVYTNGRNFLGFMDRLCRRQNSLGSLPVLDLNEYVRSPRGKILFVCSTGDGTADTAFASLLLTAVSAAAANEGKCVSVLLPEIDKWEIFTQMQEIDSQFGHSTCLVFGCTDLSALVRKYAIDEHQFFSAAGALAGICIWHRSEDKACVDLFREWNKGKEVIYGTEDLGEGLIAYKAAGQQLQYLHRDDSCKSENRCERKQLLDVKALTAWFFDKDSARELALRQKQHIKKEKAVKAGLPEELADAVLAVGLLDAGEISESSVDSAVNVYLTEALATRVHCNKLSIDELGIALGEISSGLYEIVRHESLLDNEEASDTAKQFNVDYVKRLFFKTLGGELKKKCEVPDRLAAEFDKYCLRREGDCFAQLSPEEQTDLLDIIRQTLKNRKHRSGAK